MTVSIQGEGIKLRSSQADDQQKIKDLMKATDCSLMALGQHPDRLHLYHEREQFFPEQIEELKVYRMLVEDEQGDLMGYVSFRLKSEQFKRAELSYFIADKFKGHGYATRALELMTEYAFEKLGMHRLYLEIPEENIPSMRVAEKGGFVKEGLMKEYKLIGSKWHNYWLFAKISIK